MRSWECSGAFLGSRGAQGHDGRLRAISLATPVAASGGVHSTSCPSRSSVGRCRTGFARALAPKGQDSVPSACSRRHCDRTHDPAMSTATTVAEIPSAVQRRRAIAPRELSLRYRQVPRMGGALGAFGCPSRCRRLLRLEPLSDGRSCAGRSSAAPPSATGLPICHCQCRFRSNVSSESGTDDNPCGSVAVVPHYPKRSNQRVVYDIAAAHLYDAFRGVDRLFSRAAKRQIRMA